MNRASAIELRPGYSISSIIKECSSPNGTRHGLDSATELADLAALFDAGITTIDCGDGDPDFERVLGSFRQDLHRTHGVTKAQSLRVHTKFIPDRFSSYAVGQDQVECSIDQSLARLGMEALDLVQLQWSVDDTSGSLDILGYLALMQAKGKVRYLGIANADTEDLGMLMRSGIDLATAQVPFSLIDQRPKDQFVRLCEEHNIALFASGTLAGGFISHRWLGAPDPGHEFDNHVLARHRMVIDAFGGWGLFQELLLALSGIAARHGVPLGGIALRAMHDHADVSSVILRASYADHVENFLKAFSFAPTVRDREALAAVLAKRRGPHGPVFGIERERATSENASSDHSKITAFNAVDGRRKRR